MHFHALLPSLNPDDPEGKTVRVIGFVADLTTGRIDIGISGDTIQVRKALFLSGYGSGYRLPRHQPVRQHAAHG